MIQSIKRYLERRAYAAHWTSNTVFYPHKSDGSFFRCALIRHRVFYDCMRRAKRMQTNQIDINQVR